MLSQKIETPGLHYVINVEYISNIVEVHRKLGTDKLTIIHMFLRTTDFVNPHIANKNIKTT